MLKLKSDLGGLASFVMPTICMLLQACSQGPITAPNIDKFGPRTVQAGAAFNKQKDGNSALWVHSANRLAQDAVIVLDGQKLTTHVKADGASAEVPAALYARPGSYSLQVVEEVDGKQLQSNVVQFIVKSN